jgi:Domain of unknown function (DUF4126)
MDPLSGGTFHLIFQGLGLSSAAGFNAYLPMLAVGLLARYTNLLHLGPSFDLLTNPIVLLVLAVLALADLIGDKIPAVDHFLHTVGLLVHPIIGAVLAVATTQGSHVNPVLMAICGLIMAGGIHGVRTIVRPATNAATVGTSAPLVSMAEDAAAVTLTALAVWFPVIALFFVGLFVWGLVALIRSTKTLLTTQKSLGGKKPVESIKTIENASE